MRQVDTDLNSKLCWPKSKILQNYNFFTINKQIFVSLQKSMPPSWNEAKFNHVAIYSVFVTKFLHGFAKTSIEAFFLISGVTSPLIRRSKLYLPPTFPTCSQLQWLSPRPGLPNVWPRGRMRPPGLFYVAPEP